MAGGTMWNWMALSQTGTSNDSAQDESQKKPLLQNKNDTTTKSTPTTALPSEKKAKDVQYEVESYSKLRIKDRLISAVDLQQEMQGRKFISISRMENEPLSTFSDTTVDWVSIGVLARKTISKSTSNGSSFMVWAVTDLEGIEVGVFLFSQAYETHWKMVEGSIIAILNATMLPSSEDKRFAFRISKPHELVQLGTSVDFGICKGTAARDGRCRLAVNKSKTQFCMHHIATKFMDAGRGRQQLNNAVGGFRKSVFNKSKQPKNLSSGVYTSKSSQRTSKWKVPPASGKKKKKGDAWLGVPLQLSDSGRVKQRQGMQMTSLEGPRRGSIASISSSSIHRQKKQRVDPMEQLLNRRQPGKETTADDGNKRLSRAERIISSVRPDGRTNGDQLVRPARKKVDLMQFMKKSNA